MGKFAINKTNTGYNFQLKAGNGEAIGVSEVYASLASCKKGIASVQRNAVVAGVQDTTVEGEAVKHPKFEVYMDKKEEFRFRLKATNGEVILASEGYTKKASCINGIESVRKNADGAEIVMLEK